MGLDISYDTFNAPYSAFMRFRVGLSKIVGIPDLNNMVGFGGSETWDKYNHDALCIVINHSDCDGEIILEDCKKLLVRMEIVVKEMNEGDELHRRTSKFIDGLKEAIHNNDCLEFS